MFFFPLEVSPKVHKVVLQNGISKRYLFSHRNNRRKHSQSDTEEEVSWKRGFVRPESPVVPVPLSSAQVLLLPMDFSLAIL